MSNKDGGLNIKSDHEIWLGKKLIKAKDKIERLEEYEINQINERCRIKDSNHRLRQRVIGLEAKLKVCSNSCDNYDSLVIDKNKRLNEITDQLALEKAQVNRLNSEVTRYRELYYKQIRES